MRQPSAGTRGLLSYFVRHRTAANLMMAVLLILGLAAFPQMRALLFPEVVVDDVPVNVSWDGAGAEDMDASVGTCFCRRRGWRFNHGHIHI